MGKEKEKAREARGRAAGDAGAQSSPLEFAVPGAQGWIYRRARLPLGFLSLGRVSSPLSAPTQHCWLDLQSHNMSGTSDNPVQVIPGNKSLQCASCKGAQGSLRRASAAARTVFAPGISTNTSAALGFEPGHTLHLNPNPTHENTL